ncbi:hypothetical protein [Phaeacidiphilus oryzae]|uniref:hypothetical protein n=1 Tax=Phaeacidiphilus oryzae TaxID=348818 RepID=UPI00068F4036|nr:hypothetical protein [Phaeacidiphilus oryzae]
MPRIRSGVLLSAAVLIGVLGGAGTGYAVQQHRAPTPLPPLAATQPKYPAVRSTSDGRLPAAQDDMVRTDGDLTALLIHLPAGAHEVSYEPGMNGWKTLSEYAQNFDKPADAFQTQLDDGIRRIAERSWKQGGTSYEVRLVQFQHDHEGSVKEDLNEQKDYAPDDLGGDVEEAVPPGSADEAAYAGRHMKDGAYNAEAMGRHGDILVLVFAFGEHRISAHAVASVLEQQVERL